MRHSELFQFDLVATPKRASLTISPGFERDCQAGTDEIIINNSEVIEAFKRFVKVIYRGL